MPKLSSEEKECIARLKSWAVGGTPCVEFLISAYNQNFQCTHILNGNSDDDDTSDDFHQREEYFKSHVLMNKTAGDYARLLQDISTLLNTVKRLKK